MAQSSRFITFLRGQHWSAWITGGLMIIAVVWFFGWQIANPRCAVPYYDFKPGLVAYSSLVAEYRQSLVCARDLSFFTRVVPCAIGSILVLCLSALAAVIGPIRRGKKWVLTSVLGFLAVTLFCAAWWQVGLASRGTPLTPLDTMQINDLVLHLVKVTYPDEGMDDLSDRVSLYLFTCDSSGEQCYPEEVYTNYLGDYDHYWLTVDQETHSLSVLATNSFDDDHGAQLIATPEIPELPSP